MADTVEDLIKTLKGPVSKELHTREAKRSAAKYIPHDYPGESEPSTGSEGQDSEGKAKHLPQDLPVHMDLRSEADEPSADDESREA